MKCRKLTAKETHKLSDKLNLDIDDDNTTFYATNVEETEIWSFNTRTERDEFLNRNKEV